MKIKRSFSEKNIKNEIDDYKFVNNYYCIRMTKNTNESLKGVKTKTEDIPLNTMIEESGGTSTFKFDFIFINSENGTIYYSVRDTILENIIKKSLNIDVKDINYSVDLEELYKITSIKLVENTLYIEDFFEKNIKHKNSIFENNINDIMEIDQKPIRKIFEYQYSNGMFNKNK